jgi:hypothetical protein
MMPGGSPDEPFVGSADIQSLADLSGSFDVVRSMRPFPFGMETFVPLVAATALPVLPLLLTVMPLEEIVKKLVGAIL